MDLESLRLGHLAQLGEAVDDWSAMATKLKSLEGDARDNLAARARKADWAGCNATVTREFIDKTAGEFTDAHTQATSVRNILRDTYEEFIACRSQLNEAIERGRKAHLTVSDNSNGTFTVTLNIPPLLSPTRTTTTPSAAPPLHSPEAADALRDEIQHILDKATTSDKSAADALRSLSDQSPTGFSSAAYRDRDAAAAALHNAERMARLARHSASLTPTQFDELNAQLVRYSSDPLFSERFATALGARGTLDFWAVLNDPDEHPRLLQARGSSFDDLQKNLSLTLASATQSDSRPMTNWQQDMVSLGGQPIEHRSSRNYGFQVMGSLMRFGDFDDRFLTRYGAALIGTEKERSVNGRAVQSTWYDRFNPLNTRLNHAGPDSGLDPVTGYMKALSRSPDAATTFFSDTFLTADEDNPFAKQGNSSTNTLTNFDYLFTHRDWPDDHAPDGTPTTTSHAYLSQALESATTGHPAGQSPSPNLPPHSFAQAALTERLITAISNDNTLLTDHPNMSSSLGQITAEYLPDINRAMADDESGDMDLLFPVAGSSAEPSHEQVTRFLVTLGQLPEGYARVELGQKSYMASLMDYHMNPDLPESLRYPANHQTTIEDIAARSGEIGGDLAIGRQEAVLGSAKEKEQAYSDALDRSKNMLSGIVGTGIGVGATFVASPVGGAAASGVASTVSGLVLEEIFRANEPENLKNSMPMASGRWENGRDSNIALVQHAARNAAELHGAPYVDSVNVWARRGASDGFTEAGTNVNRMAMGLETEVE